MMVIEWGYLFHKFILFLRFGIYNYLTSQKCIYLNIYYIKYINNFKNINLYILYV